MSRSYRNAGSIGKGIQKALLVSLAIILASQQPLVAQKTASVYNGSTSGQRNLVSVEFNSTPLADALHALARQVKVGISYDSETMPQKTITYRGEDTPVFKALETILSGTGLIATLSENRKVILIKEKPLLQKAIRQETITGTVTDAQSGETLPGVNILVKGTSTGTSTDSEGNFKLTVPSLQDTLVVSFIGYQTTEVPIQGRTKISIEMQFQAIAGEEMVVVGYGQQREKALTGSISSISSKDIKDDPATDDIATVLRGQAAGVLVTTGGNKPGDEANIRIRGNRSLSANNSPLYVIDGIPVTGGIGDFNVQNIESIEVLKDASATAIYGSRGANGVILVTTENGSSGSTIISYNTYLSLSRPHSRVQMMNGQQFADYKREAYIASGRYTSDTDIFSPIEIEMMKQNDWTDYQNELMKTGIAQNHNLSVSGGTDNTTYNISTDFLNDEGVVPLQKYKRNSLRINLDHSFGRFRIGTSTVGIYSVRNGENNNPFNYALRLNPLSRPYDDNGNLLLRTTPSTSSYNPLAMIVPDENVEERKKFRLFSSLFGEINLSDNLQYRINFGPDLSQYRFGQYTGSRTPQRRGGSAVASSSEGFKLDYTLENLITYSEVFGENHMLDITGLYSIQSHQIENTGLNVRGVPTNNIQYYNFNSSEEIGGVQSSFTKWNILSGMLRVNYNFDDRYMMTITGRSDGSSRFGSNHKWGFFPSAALAWTISNEEFMSDNSLWNMLKVRLSYGKTGNTGISPYQTLGILSRTSYDFGGEPGFGFRPSRIQNNNLKWEKTVSFNAGVDFSLLKNRISGTLELYRQNTSDLLLERQLPQSSGFQSILENVGKTRNTGLEGTLSGVIMESTRSFNWNLDLNFAINKEEIVELYGGKSDDIGNRWFIGEPTNVHYDYKKIGIWQLGEESEAENYDTRVGQIKIKDQNEDGRIDSDDRMILGSNNPKLSGGLTSNFNYKQFTLSIDMYGSLGNMISSPFHTSRNTLFGRYNNLNVDYWTPENPTNAYPQPYSDQERPLYNTTMSYFNGSYLKVRNIKIGYDLPLDLAAKLYTRSLNVYISAQNPLIISPYVNDDLGLDPENPTLSSPFTKSLIIGLNISI